MTLRFWLNHAVRWPLPLYLVVSVAATWPLVAHLGSRIPTGTGSDVWVHVWTFWWLKTALLNGENPLFTPFLFHPTGASLTSHNIAWYNFVLWFPLQAALGANVAHSLSYLALFSLNAYAMYLFVYARLRDRGAAWIAGLIFGFWPYTLSQSDHPNMLPVGWLPLALLYLQRSVTGGARRDAVLAGLFLALLGISRWQLLIMAAPIAGLFVIYQVISARAMWRLQTWAMVLTAGVAMALLIAPLGLPVIVAQLTRPFADDLLIFEPEFSADLLAYVLPHQRSLLWSSLVERLPTPLQFTQQEIHFIGYTSLVLAAVGLYGRWRRSLFWIVAALILIVLALGPTLTAGHQAYPSLPTPYILVEDWLITRIVRMPHRYSIFLGLPISMLAALGVTYLRARAQVMNHTGAEGFRSPRWAMILLVVFTLLILSESSPAPYPLTDTTIPPWYHQLAEEPESFAILTLPISPRRADKFAMHYQTLHGKPLVGGHVSRQPRETIAYMVASPLLDDLLFRREMNPALLDVSHQLRYLAEADIRYLVLQKDFATDEQIDAWRDWLTVRPRYEDDSTLVYVTAPRAGIDFDVDRQFTPDIGLIRASYAPTQATQGDLVSIDVRWAGLDPSASDLEVCARLTGQTDENPLDFTGSGSSVAWLNCHAITPDWPTSNWQADEVARGEYLFPVAPHQMPAVYELELTLREPNARTLVGQPIPLGPLALRPLPRRFQLPDPEYDTDLQLGDAVYLHGYDLAVADTIRLTLYWQALKRMDASYKVFVHLLDSPSGTILAQHDAPPRAWQYPTSWWEEGEIVDETIELSIAGIGARQPHLVLGVYDEATGERLPLLGGSGETYENHAFPLPLPPLD